MTANYHTHTRWCRHGAGEIEDFVEAAIRAGLSEIAITEHVPLPGDPDGNRMYFSEFEAFDAALDAAIARYAGRIAVRKGFECEYYPEMLNYYEWLRGERGYEILLLGQHTSVDMGTDYFAPKGPAEAARYADEVVEGIRTGLFDILAHPDLPIVRYEGERAVPPDARRLSPGHPDAAFLAAMRKVFQACAERGVLAEINANGMRDGRGYPCPAAWEAEARRARGLRAIVNADAHYPEFLAGPHIAACESLAASLGLTVANGPANRPARGPTNDPAHRPAKKPANKPSPAPGAAPSPAYANKPASSPAR
jgi:HisJ family histidinol phosphate phosphatase